MVTNSQIKAVLGRRCRHTDGLLVLHRAETDLAYPRLGISIGRSCGGAVIRNRLKRLIREAFRLGQDHAGSHVDYVVMVSPAGLRRLGKGGRVLTLQQVQRSLHDLIRRGTTRPGHAADGQAPLDQGHGQGAQR